MMVRLFFVPVHFLDMESVCMSNKKKLARQKFREAVVKRDRNKCVICKKSEALEVHHITDRSLMPGGGYVKENGILLCSEHLAMAEQYHLSEGENCPEGFIPDQLYRKVGASYPKALLASERLEK
ncbi:MAG: hypothetical protein ACI92E_001387 [Oceanicoccus sp.]|jgi:hypothetical protein